MQRAETSRAFPLGSQLPSFSLPSVNGELIGDEYLRTGRISLVVFSCNHCPYVKGSEKFLIDLVKKYEPLGLRTIAINSNDAQSYPEDSFEKMREKSKAMQLPYSYLHDESQAVAKLFDAACTPECYLFDINSSLIFHGTIIDSPKDPSNARAGYLAQALEQAVQGKKPSPAFVHPLGCSIKWK